MSADVYYNNKMDPYPQSMAYRTISEDRLRNASSAASHLNVSNKDRKDNPGNVDGESISGSSAVRRVLV